MFKDYDYSTIKQTLFNAAAGGAITLVAGTLGTYIVRYLQGKSFELIPANHPLITCIKVIVIVLPLWYLYQHYGRDYTPSPLDGSAYELITFATAIGIIKTSKTKVYPLLMLALILTHLSWKIFAATEEGSKLLDI